MPEQIAAIKATFEKAHGIRLEERDAPWTAEEIKALDQILTLLPASLVSNNKNIKVIVRERNYSGEHAGAPGHGMYRENAGPLAKKDYLVIYDKGVYKDGALNLGLMSKVVIHELSHSFDDENDQRFEAWKKLSGWTLENGQWLSTNGDNFVNEYASQHPKEDFAESFTSYLLDPERLLRVSPQKYIFMDGLFHEGAQSNG